MKRLALLLLIGLLLIGTASATTSFRVTTYGGAVPFFGHTTTANYNSGTGEVIRAYQDPYHARVAWSTPQTSFQSSWHNPHTVAYHGSSYNTAHRTYQPTGWQMQSATVRSQNYGVAVRQSPYDGRYVTQARIGNAPSPVYPTAYRQPTPMRNPWATQSSWGSYRTPSAHVRPTNYW